ncbi:MAG: TonB-dependent receptor [Euryarchaeota archaeon]|nr:TonB-dependent receptor [Euryarchaeota archaeon]
MSRVIKLFILASLIGFSGPSLSNEYLEEIVVVAEKRDENLKDISQAVTVLLGEELRQKNINTFVDLSAIAPGVTVTKNEGYKTIISIRGIGNETNQNAIAAPSVAYHLDGVYVASPFALQTDFIDVEHIEILRGPQGTLFGQNSTGGVINVISQAPSDVFGMNADLTAGDYNLTKFRVSLNSPISESFSTRNSVSVTNRDGFSTNLLNGQDLDDMSSISARTDWEYMKGIARLRVFGQYFDADNNGAAMKGIDDQTPNPRELVQDTEANFELTSKLAAAILEIGLSNSTLKAIASWQKDDVLIKRDNDRHNFGDIHIGGLWAGLPYIRAEYDPETSIVETKTFEINILSETPLFGKLDWTVGGFYLDHEIENHIREYKDVNNVYEVGLADGQFTPYVHNPECPACFAIYGAEVGFISDAFPTRESYSAYAQTTLHITDTLRLITGIRYTDDTVDSFVSNFFGIPGQVYNLNENLTETTGRVAVEWDVSDGTMTYLSVTKGFKPGGSNLTFGFDNDNAPVMVFPIFENEEIMAYELGLKMAGEYTRLNIAIFYYDYENLQFQATDPDIYRGGVANIPEVEVKGGELELTQLLTDSLTFDLKVSFLESNIKSSYEALDNVKAEPYFFGQEAIRYGLRENIQGNDLAKTPNMTANASLKYEKFFDSGLFTGILEYVHRGEFQQRVINNPTVDTVPSYNIVNLLLSYDLANEKLGFDLMAYNLTDEVGVNSRMTDVFGVSATGIELIPPKQIMGRIRYTF